MIVITSASFIDQEFSSEFGRLPPAFLPVGNRRLYAYQARYLPDSERRVLTLPESYSISRFDRARLERLGIETLHIPEGLSLGESIVCAINLSGHPPGAPLRILHGDTLIQDLPADDLDVVTLSEVDGAYNWAVWHDSGESRLSHLDEDRSADRVRIVNGYFAFSESGLFVRSVIKASGNFVEGINHYSRVRPLKGLTVQSWFDFGHAHTYYRSKARMTTQRVFNRLNIDREAVRKTSEDATKMEAEHHWFSSLPGDLRIFVPQLLGRVTGPEPGYEIQYLYLPSLSELFVFGRLPLFAWHKIFNSCLGFLDACREHPPESPVEVPLTSLFNDKTSSRLEQWAGQADIDLDSPWVINGRDVPGIAEIADVTGDMLAALDQQSPCVVHGDFCFSNILFDFRSLSVKVIDPRGCLPDGTNSIYGDQRYDVGKLAHSVCGMYDFIVAEDYGLEVSGRKLHLDLPVSEAIRRVQDLFLRIIEERYGLGWRILCAMQVHLFLSMIPLHADDPRRQTAFLANALRLYAELG